MYYTYVLLCSDTKRFRKRFYIGITNDLQRRIEAHKNESTKTTKSFNTLELVYYEASLSKSDAIRRERQLKTGFGRGYIKRRIKDYLVNPRV